MINDKEDILQKTADYMERNVRSQVNKMEAQESFSLAIIQDMAQMGLLGASLPKEYGGLELDPLTYGRLTEVIGKVSSTARTLLTVHTSLVGETLARYGNEGQKEKYLRDICRGSKIACFALTEPENGTDAATIKTSYEKKEQVYILNGHKRWISLAGIADLMLVMAVNCTDNKKMSAFLVDRKAPGIEVTPVTGLLAARDAYISEIRFKNVEIPADNLLCKEGEGFAFVANTALFYGRYSIAWGGLATAQAALEEMVTYARKRKQFGKRIGEFQLIQGIIGDAVAQITAARSLCISAGEMRVKGQEDAVMQTNIAKYITSRISVQICADAVQVLGGNGCCSCYPVERLFRESKILEIIEGTSQIQQVMLANYGMRKFYKRENTGV